MTETQTLANKTRAMDALERAAELAERGVSSRPVVLVASGDLDPLVTTDVRPLLDRVMMGEHADEGLDSLLTTGVLDVLLPEVKGLVGFGDGEWRHKDVWKHTKQVVCQAVPRIEVRWAALLHDIGKVKTRSIDEHGEVHFFGHAEVGARMFDKLERRRRLFAAEEELRSTIRFLVLHHLRASQYDGSWTDSAVRRFAREIGPHLDDLLCLSRADITTKRPERKRKGLEAISELAVRVREIQTQDAKVPPLPKGLGTSISERLGIAPSPKLGELMKLLKDAVEGGDLDAQREPDYYLDWLVQSGHASSP